MDSTQKITKRLHISGLTPALTAADISQRLSSFGIVKAVDGFGLLDGVGLPRKFGYVTLETTSSQLARCLNLLSGSTWKGAKLRIGEAKPDYAQRLAKERAQDQKEQEDSGSAEPPQKRQRLSKSRFQFAATHAADMSPVTPENVHEHSRWNVTPLGRILRPMRMRPLRPLPPLPSSSSTLPTGQANNKMGKGLGKDKKKRMRERIPDTRARRRTIDMTKWGSTHLKGVFLEVGVSTGLSGVSGVESGSKEETKRDMTNTVIKSRLVNTIAAESVHPNRTEEAYLQEEVESSGDESQNLQRELSSPLVPKNKPLEEPKSAPIASIPRPTGTSNEIDLTNEKSATLGLLASIFGNEDDDWGGKESVGSDIDEQELLKEKQGYPRHRPGEEDNQEITYEEVPIASSGPLKRKRGDDHHREGDDDEYQKVGLGAVAGNVPASELGEDTPAQSPTRIAEQTKVQAQTQTQSKVQPTKLKDLFAPKDDNAGFSLLGHLDLDLELDDEYIPFDTTQSEVVARTVDTPQPDESSRPKGETERQINTQSQSQSQSQNTAHRPQAYNPIHIDPKQPLFFPPSLAASSLSASNKAQPKYIIDVLKDRGWYWSDEKLGFWRTETEGEIRKRWEENKRDLTADWKKRWKEAVRSGRRKRGGARSGGGRGAGVSDAMGVRALGGGVGEAMEYE